MTPPEYWQPIENDPRGTWALYRGMAAMFASLAKKIERSFQSAFYRPHALQTEVPASSGRKASSTIKIDRGTDDLSQPRVIGPGSMVLTGPQGRRYVNRDRVEWLPFDATTVRSVLFEAVAAGYCYNLDHLADPDGLITAGVYDAAKGPNANGPDLSKVEIAALSGARTSIGASIFEAIGTSDHSRIQDTGKPSVFRATDEGLYIRIDVATNLENVGRVLRVIGFEDPKIEDPVGSGLYPRTVIVDDGLQRTRPLSAQADDGGVFTDETVAASSEAVDDMTLISAVPAVGDAYYLGSAGVFLGVQIDLSQVAQATALEIAVEGWDGFSWLPMPDLVDGTVKDGVALGQSGTITFSELRAWAQNPINGVTARYIRLRVVTATGVTQQPLGQKAYTLDYSRLIPEAGSVTWSLLDWRDLGFAIQELAAPTGGRDDILRLLGDERGVYQQTDEPDDDFRERAGSLAEVVSPKAIRNAVNRALEPYGFRGRAFDLQNDGDGSLHFDGMFADIDAADYYSAGDIFPESPYKLPISDSEDAVTGIANGEARGIFFVELPWIGVGDFGIFADEGPIQYLESAGVFIGPAADEGFVDGFSVGGNAVYRAIYDSVHRIRAGGIGFVMSRNDDLNTPPCP